MMVTNYICKCKIIYFLRKCCNRTNGMSCNFQSDTFDCFNYAFYCETYFILMSVVMTCVSYYSLYL